MRNKRRLGLASIAAIFLLGASPPRTRYVDWGRNPFAVPTAKTSSGLSLSGIMWDKKSPHAIINDTVVGVGDFILGKKVLEIRQDVVMISEGDGKTLELRLE